MVVCTDECSVISRWILFSLNSWNEHVLELWLDVLFLNVFKIGMLAIFWKWWLWGLSVIFDGTLYGRVLAYPSMNFVFLWHMERTYIGAVHTCIICEKSLKKWNLTNFWKMVILRTLYGRVLGYPSMDFVFLWHLDRTYIMFDVLKIVLFLLFLTHYILKTIKKNYCNKDVANIYVSVIMIDCWYCDKLINQ